MAWTVPDMWKDGECWILGGGASMLKQFDIPHKVIQSVRDRSKPPSVYSPYIEPILRGKNVIGINAAYLIGPWLKVIFFGDTGFFTKNRKPLATYPGLVVTCADRAVYNYDKFRVKVLLRDKKRQGISNDKTSLCWNNNSGAASISLAAHFGVKKIYLLGFDMKPDSDERTHWHSHYDKKIREATFNRHLKGWPNIATDAKKRGIEIINLSPNSSINEFPKMSLKDIL